MPPVRSTVLTTLRGPHDRDWESATDYISVPTRVGTLWWVIENGWRAKRHRALIVRGTTGAADLYRDLLLAAVVRRFAPTVPVVVSDATIEPASRSLSKRSAVLRALAPRLARGLLHLVDGPLVTWCVLSTAETISFPATWGLTRGAVVFTPFSHTLFGYESDEGAPLGQHVFSGGNSLRDHDLLIEAARGLDLQVVIATALRPSGSTPANVSVRETGHEEFLRLMETARAVVLCLRDSSRSTGQQTYLNAMALGRPVIVTDAKGVRDYVDDGVTGYVVTPTVPEVRRALEDVADPSRRRDHEAIGAHARQVVRSRFTDRAYRRSLLRIVDERPVAADGGVVAGPEV